MGRLECLSAQCKHLPGGAHRRPWRCKSRRKLHSGDSFRPENVRYRVGERSSLLGCANLHDEFRVKADSDCRLGSLPFHGCLLASALAGNRCAERESHATHSAELEKRRRLCGIVRRQQDSMWPVMSSFY